MTASDIDDGTTTYHAGTRIVIRLTIYLISICTTTGSINVATVSTVFLIEIRISDSPPRIWSFRTRNLVSNTDSTAIHIHISILVVVTILTTAIDRTLNEWLCQVIVRVNCSSFRTDIDDSSSHPCYPIILVYGYW